MLRGEVFGVSWRFLDGKKGKREEEEKDEEEGNGGRRRGRRGRRYRENDAHLGTMERSGRVVNSSCTGKLL